MRATRAAAAGLMVASMGLIAACGKEQEPTRQAVITPTSIPEPVVVFPSPQTDPNPIVQISRLSGRAAFDQQRAIEIEFTGKRLAEIDLFRTSQYVRQVALEYSASYTQGRIPYENFFTRTLLIDRSDFNQTYVELSKKDPDKVLDKGSTFVDLARGRIYINRDADEFNKIDAPNSALARLSEVLKLRYTELVKLFPLFQRFAHQRP